MDNNPELAFSAVLKSHLVKSTMIRLGIMVFLLILAASEWLGLSDPELRFRLWRQLCYMIFFVSGFGLNLTYLLFQDRLLRSRAFAPLQLVMDGVLTTAWVFLTGGIFSGFLFIYVLGIFFYGRFLKFSTMLGASCGLCVILFLVSCVQFYFPQFWGVAHIRGSDIAYNYSLFTLALILVTSLVLLGQTQEKRLLYTVFEQQSALRKAEELRFRIVDWMDSGLMALDHAGRITTINKRALEWISEHDRDKVLNTFFGRFFPEFLSCWSEQQSWCANRNTVLSPERGIVFGFRVTELPEAHGWLVLFSDITEVKKLEKRVQDMEKMATVGELAAGLAHEMKNPLAGIKASLQLLLSDDLEQEYARRLSAVIVRDIDRLDFLLKDFLVFARPQPSSPEPLALAEEIEDVLMPLRLRYPRVGVRVELGLERIAFDRNHLHQILLNLCMNAFQAVEGRDNSMISITEHQGDGGRKLVVADNGPGMPPEIRARCFDPFVTTKAVGTGLGLSIAQRLAAQNGAFIDVDSDQTGTRVVLVQHSSPTPRPDTERA